VRNESKKSIYDFPDIYDIILRASFDQIETEVNSILRLLAERGITKGRILELACGTCSHGLLLAQHGFSVTGVDISQNMFDGARIRAKSAGIEMELHHGDIIDFDLDTEPFDCAIFMAETFPLITEYEDIESHFQSVRRHLKKSGIYIIDVDAHKHGVGTQYQVWGQRTVPLNNGWVEVWHEDFPGDWIRGTSHLIMHCRIHLGDSVYETVDDWKIRMDSPWNLSILVKTLKNWSLVGFFSWKDLSLNITEERHYFMVLE
jgi:ubiquinone/menaquinone biosynthesis C-methylase UbiE